MSLTLEQLAEQIGAVIAGDGESHITGAATLEEAGPSQISFLSNPQYEKLLATTNAGAVIVASDVACERLNLLKTAIRTWPLPGRWFCCTGIAAIRIAAFIRAFVELTASVGERTVIYPGVYVGPRSKIGNDCILYPNVVIYDDCIIGDRVIIHSGASLGHDGFGFATSKGVHHKIPQVGNVVVEEDVEIGANAAIARAAMGSTTIGRGTKIDSLVSIGHGVKIGANGLLVSQVGISGSTRWGET